MVGEVGCSAEEPPAASANRTLSASRHAGGEDLASALLAEVSAAAESLGLSMRRTKAGTRGLSKPAGGRGAEAAPLGAGDAKSICLPVAKSTVASEPSTCQARGAGSVRGAAHKAPGAKRCRREARGCSLWHACRAGLGLGLG